MTRSLTLVLLMTSLSACADLPSDSVICRATEQPAKTHAAALVEDGGPASQRTGELLLTILDTGCN